MMQIEIVGVKRSTGKMDNGTSFSGWKCFFTYKALDPQINGCDVGDKFFSDQILNGVVPQPGDKFDIVYNFEGRLMSVKPIIEPKLTEQNSQRNYNQPASK